MNSVIMKVFPFVFHSCDPRITNLKLFSLLFSACACNEVAWNDRWNKFVHFKRICVENKTVPLGITWRWRWILIIKEIFTQNIQCRERAEKIHCIMYGHVCTINFWNQFEWNPSNEWMNNISFIFQMENGGWRFACMLKSTRFCMGNKLHGISCIHPI